jgi:hypothetical protein
MLLICFRARTTWAPPGLSCVRLQLEGEVDHDGRFDGGGGGHVPAPLSCGCAPDFGELGVGVCYSEFAEGSVALERHTDWLVPDEIHDQDIETARSLKGDIPLAKSLLPRKLSVGDR